MKSVMAAPEHFARTPSIQNIQRSVFNRSCGYKTTFDAGYLVPIFVDEVLPGDSSVVKATTFARLATQIVPLMDNISIDIHFWFVPYRLVWTNWEKFNGAQDNPGDSISFLVPQMAIPAGGFAVSSLFDYMGIPTGVQSAGVTKINTLHLRAYNLIWNTWYRDENLQTSVVVRTGDSGDLVADYNVLRRGKRYDYFTSCLPSPQKGSAVTLPLGTSARVQHDAVNGGTLGVYSTVNSGYREMVSSTASLTAGTSASVVGQSLYADLSTATAATINSIRTAVTIQQLLERDMRGGTRYIEILLSHFGVVSPDFRLQRPEYLGGGSTRLGVHPVPQTSGTGATGTTTPAGYLSSFATFSHHDIGFAKSFVEHGVIIGLVNAKADLNYQQGLDKMWSRQTRYDYYWPTFAHLGEQAVLNQEIYMQDTVADQSVFGYQERYGEYRFKQSLCTGKFRSNAAGTLQVFHLAQQFGALPALNNLFIADNPPMARIKAVTTEPDFIFDCYFDYRCARPMPVYSVPGLKSF